MAAVEGGLKVTSVNGVKVYSITGQRAVASWKQEKSGQRKSKNRDQEFLQRLDLIQDLKFSTAATRMKLTPDGDYMVASGVYPPQVRVYDLREMALKFERHLTSEIVDFQILGEDYSKLAFLGMDRSISLHAKFGSYFSTRIPRMGRDLAYDKWSCDLMVAASSPEVYRLNLEQGRFLEPFSSRSPGFNVIGRSPIHGLMACGGEDGALECFDPRMKRSAARIDVVSPTGNPDQQVTALRFDETDGLLLAAGTSGGQVLIYDVRSSAPITIKDHMYDSPIVDIKWHDNFSSTRSLLSADQKVVRIWDYETGIGTANIEPSAGAINDVCVVKNTGLMFLALDNPVIPSYFIPSLGSAPKWCSHLDNLTEELEDGGQTTIYDDYKFVTKDDLESLNLTNLIGTNLLRAYMHGYFIDHRLYAKAKSIADPFAYETYRQQRIKEKVEEKRASRITIKRKLPKVNKELASLLMAENDDEDDDNLKKKKKKVQATEILQDDRFARLFTNEEFAIDRNAEEYKALHPSKKESLLDEHFDLVESEGEEEDEVESSSDEETGAKRKAPAPRLYKAKDETHAKAFKDHVSLANQQSMPMEERVAAAEQNGETETKARWGSREQTFVLPSQKKQSDNHQRGDKRGIQSLGLKSDKPYVNGRGGHGGGRGRGRGRGGRGRGRGRGRH